MTEYEIAKNAINNLLNSETSKQEIELAILVEYMSLLKEKHEISKRITVIKTELDEIHEKMSETRFFSYNDHNEVTLLHNLDETGVDLRDDEDDYTHYGLRKLVNNIPKKMTMPLTNFKSDKKSTCSDSD